MAKKSELLTSSEFSSKTGIPTSTISKLIREKKIKAVKKSGKWMIGADQLNAKVVKEVSKPGKPSPQKKKAASKPKKAPVQAKKAAAPGTAKPAADAKSFSIVEFAAMTYLTEKGVMQWLKSGLLSGQQDDKGNWRIDAANLQVPNVKRLVRES